MRLPDIYFLLIRLLLGYVFMSSGLCKLTGGQFGQLIGPPTAQMLPGLEGIWLFLATSQVLVGALVLSGRWALLGLLALLPLNTGILAYTLGNHWTGTPYVNGFFLLLNLVALAAEWPVLRFLVVTDAPPPAGRPRLVALWPGGQWPAVSVLMFAAAAASALLGAPVGLTAGLGAAGLFIAWAHALRAPGLARRERIALALPGLATICLSVGPMIAAQTMLPLLLLGVVAGVIAVVVPTAFRLTS